MDYEARHIGKGELLPRRPFAEASATLKNERIEKLGIEPAPYNPMEDPVGQTSAQFIAQFIVGIAVPPLGPM